MKKFKLNNIENCTIKVTNLEVTDFDFYGTSAKFTYDVIDKETSLPVIEDEEVELTNCFTGYELDDDEIESYLEYKNLDPDEFYDEEEYEWKLTDEMWEEINDETKEKLADCYWEAIEYDENDLYGICEKIMEENDYDDLHYIVESGKKVHVLDVEENYYGTKITCDTLHIKKVYYTETEDYVYLINNEVMLDTGYGYMYIMDDKFTKCIFTEDDLQRLEENCEFPGFCGGIGSVYYTCAEDYSEAVNY